MDVKQLIEIAKKNSGMSLGAMAEDLGVGQARISQWKPKYPVFQGEVGMILIMVMH